MVAHGGKINWLRKALAKTVTVTVTGNTILNVHKQVIM